MAERTKPITGAAQRDHHPHMVRRGDVVTMETPPSCCIAALLQKSTIETRFMKAHQGGAEGHLLLRSGGKDPQRRAAGCLSRCGPGSAGSCWIPTPSPSRRMWWGRRTSWPMRRHGPVADKPAENFNLCSSTATPDWARPICSTPSPIRSSASGRTCGSCTSRATTLPTS